MTSTNKLILGKGTTNTTIEGMGVDGDDVLYIATPEGLVGLDSAGVETELGGGGGGYENVIVVDAGGRGDHTTLKGAMDWLIVNGVEDSTVYVMSSTTETSAIDLPEVIAVTAIIPTGVVVNLGSNRIRTSPGCDFTLSGGGKITNSGSSSPLDNDAGNNKITIAGGITIEHNGSTAAWDHKQTTTEINFSNCDFSGAGADLLFTATPPVGSVVWNCRLLGAALLGSVFGSWANANIYGCYFATAPQAGFTFDAGTAAGTNVIPT